MGQMAELVDDHIVEDGGRRKHKPPVEGEGAFRTAASPAGFLVADGDAAVIPARERGKVGGAFRKVFFRGVDITLFEGGALCVRQIGFGSVFAPLYSLQIMPDNPRLLFKQKTVNLRLRGAKGQPQGDFSLRGDAYGARSAAAVDYLVGQFI